MKAKHYIRRCQSHLYVYFKELVKTRLATSYIVKPDFCKTEICEQCIMTAFTETFVQYIWDKVPPAIHYIDIASHQGVTRQCGGMRLKPEFLYKATEL